ncbi:hypothetical protein B0H19DRAFT_1372372 [Mycena capillaripes]|nr:hypothetical protein B0H19DRAFT_1372372 [Mycena capillaripes]
MDLELKSTSFDEPRLLPELEREIFEIAAVSRPMSISTLMLIAGRISDWVEPPLYRVVIITESPRDSVTTHFASNDISLCTHLRPFLHATLTQLQCIVALTPEGDLEADMDGARQRFVFIEQTDYWDAPLAARITGQLRRRSLP